MGTLIVVLEHPPARRVAHVVEAGEQVLFADLLAEGSVEVFDVGVLVGLAGLDVSDCHAVELGLLHEGFAQELVGAQDLVQAVVALELLEDADQAGGRDRGVDFDVQRLAVKTLGHAEGSEAAATGEYIGHETAEQWASGDLET
jgi:hypothetical protein